jgi:hypothetical protein
MENFTPIRNGLLDHALSGKLSPFDFGIFVFLIMRADYSTGICSTCALTIACQFGNPSEKKHIQRALYRLRERKFINYPGGDGSRGAYPILINKFLVTVGGLSGCRLNAWKHGDLAQPEYEPADGGAAVEGRSAGGGAAVVRPNKELRLKDFEDNPRAQARELSQSKVNRKPIPNCLRCLGKGYWAHPAHPGMVVECDCLDGWILGGALGSADTSSQQEVRDTPNRQTSAPMNVVRT